MISGRMNQGAVGRRPRRRSQLRTRPLGESEKRWLMGEARREVRRVVQRGSCDVAARGARCAAIAHEVYATPRDSVTGAVAQAFLPVPQVATCGALQYEETKAAFG